MQLNQTSNRGITHAWKQVQGVPVYVLTVHKAQGLTMKMVYLSFSAVFGFGQVYTALTRCPHIWATFLIGVPPKDVLAAIFEPNGHGETLIDLKRKKFRLCLLMRCSFKSRSDSCT